MKKLLSVALILLLSGCLTTENRKVEITLKDIPQEERSDIWWGTPYTDNRSADNPWDSFVGEPPRDTVAEDLEYFENNPLRWPAEMPPAYEAPASEPEPESETPTPEVPTPEEPAAPPVDEDEVNHPMDEWDLQTY